jgi:hypothetical protein
MNDLDLFEQGTHVFTGTFKARHGPFAELVTDSGLSVTLTTEGNPQLLEGARVTVVARKYLPRYHMIKIVPE